MSELSPAQQAVLEPAYIYGRPLIEDDGVTVDADSRTDTRKFSYQTRQYDERLPPERGYYQTEAQARHRLGDKGEREEREAAEEEAGEGGEKG